MSTFFIALGSILTSVLAQFCLKGGMSAPGVREALAAPFGLGTVTAVATEPRIILGFGLYGFGALAWLVVLSRWDVSKAYPLVGLGFAVTVVVGALGGEQVGITRMLGVAFICAGVLLVARS